MTEKVATFFARGTGGAEFEFDELNPATARGENLAGQINSGELVVLDKKGGQPLESGKVDEMLAPFGITRGAVVVGEPIIEGPGPALPIDPDVDLDRPQVGDAIPLEQVESPPADQASGQPLIVPDDGEHEINVSALVPAGKADDVLDWVRGGPVDTEPTDGWEDRARAALDAEQAKDKPGKGLTEKLEEILAPDED